MATKTKSAAVLTIHRASQFTPAGRRRIVDWLRRQAKFLSAHSDQYATRYTARYLYK